MEGNGSGVSALLGLDGFVVRAQLLDEATGEWWLAVETTEDRGWCPSCGVRAVGHGRRRVQVRDLRMADPPVVVVCAAVALRGAGLCDRDRGGGGYVLTPALGDDSNVAASKQVDDENTGRAVGSPSLLPSVELVGISHNVPSESPHRPIGLSCVGARPTVHQRERETHSRSGRERRSCP